MLLILKQLHKTQIGQRLLTLAFVLLFSAVIFAQESMTIGGEFEFTNKEISAQALPGGVATNGLEHEFQSKLIKHIREKHPELKVVFISGKWFSEARFLLPDGFWFQVSADPGVIEIKTSPATIDTWESKAPQLNDLIWGSAHEIGLNTSDPDLAGHFNFGIKSLFSDDTMLFTRFFIDYANHPELAGGALGIDTYNGPPLAQLRESSRIATTVMLAKLETGQLMSIFDVAQFINRSIYTNSSSASEGFSGLTHYQAFGLKSFSKISKMDFARADTRGELRSIYAQTSAEDFIILAKLIRQRVLYLKKLQSDGVPIVFQNRVHDEIYTGSEVTEKFYRWLLEMDADPSLYKSLMREPYRKRKPSDFLLKNDVWDKAFMTSLRFHADDLDVSPWLKDRFITAFQSKSRSHLNNKLLAASELLGLVDVDTRPTLVESIFDVVQSFVDRHPRTKDPAMVAFREIFKAKQTLAKESLSKNCELLIYRRTLMPTTTY